MNRKWKTAVALGASALIVALAFSSATKEEGQPADNPKMTEVAGQEELPKIPTPAPAPPVPSEAVATVPPQPKPAQAEPKISKTPDGKFVIEGRTVQLRFADGHIEEKPVRIVATPVQPPLRRIARSKDNSVTTPSSQNP